MKRPDTLTIFPHVVGPWRWRLQSANGRIIGASTEGYARRVDCIANAARVLDLPSDPPWWLDLAGTGQPMMRGEGAVPLVVIVND